MPRALWKMSDEVLAFYVKEMRAEGCHGWAHGMEGNRTIVRDAERASALLGGAEYFATVNVPEALEPAIRHLQGLAADAWRAIEATAEEFDAWRVRAA